MFTFEGLKSSVSDPRGSESARILKEPCGDRGDGDPELMSRSCDLARGNSHPVQEDVTTESPRISAALWKTKRKQNHLLCQRKIFVLRKIRGAIETELPVKRTFVQRLTLTFLHRPDWRDYVVCG